MTDRYLTPGISAANMASAFRSAAVLYRAAPWSIILGDDDLITVTAESLGLRDAAISVVGQHGSIFGFLLFPGGAPAFEAFARAAPLIARGARPPVPAHATLMFVPRKELLGPMRKEAARHGWEVASPAAYPLFAAADSDPDGRWPTQEELERLEAMALTLSELVANEPRLARAAFGTDTFERTFQVVTHGGTHRVDARAGMPAGRGAEAPRASASYPSGHGPDEAREHRPVTGGGAGYDGVGTAAIASQEDLADELRKERNRRKAERRKRR